MQAAPTDTPYADLTPEHALDILEALGLPVDGRLLQLNSYENRVFQIGLDDGSSVVAKFYRPGRWSDAQIHEEHSFAHDLALAEVPAVPPQALALPEHSRHAALAARLSGALSTLGHVGAHRVAVSTRKGGRGPELEDPEVLRWIGRFLARLHQVGDRQRFKQRRTLNVAQHGRAARDSLAQSPWLQDDPAARRWLQLADQALDLCDAAFALVPDLRLRRIHGDCHPGNILWTPDGPHFVDLDDACAGPAIQDMWMLVSGDPQDRQVQLHALLDGYEAMADFDWRELALIEPLRTLRIIHHSDWLARRWHDPAFPAAFPWFGEPTYWQGQCGLLMQQIEAMQNQAEPMPADDDDWR